MQKSASMRMEKLAAQNYFCNPQYTRWIFMFATDDSHGIGSISEARREQPNVRGNMSALPKTPRTAVQCFLVFFSLKPREQPKKKEAQVRRCAGPCCMPALFQTIPTSNVNFPSQVPSAASWREGGNAALRKSCDQCTGQPLLP